MLRSQEIVSWVTLPRIWTQPLPRQLVECISTRCHQSPIRKQRQFVMGTTFSRKLYAWQLFFTITPLTWLILKDKLKKNNNLVTKVPLLCIQTNKDPVSWALETGWWDLSFLEPTLKQREPERKKATDIVSGFLFFKKKRQRKKVRQLGIIKFNIKPRSTCLTPGNC